MCSPAKGASEHLSVHAPRFTVLCRSQTLRVNSSGRASRDTAAKDLHDALSALEFQKSSRAVEGGGVAISVGPAIQAFTDNEVIVSFCGHLTNVDYLAWRLFSPEGRRGEAITQSPLLAASKLVGGRCYEAELICHMYKAFGTKSLPKLRGRFSFACFDSRSVRVFAARDPSGTYPLMYGRDVDGTVVIANFDSANAMFRSVRSSKLNVVPAGCFIYGHRRITPQRYANDEAVSQIEAAAAADAAANALRGLTIISRKFDDTSFVDEKSGISKAQEGGCASGDPTASICSFGENEPADSTTLPPPLCAAASQCSSQHNCTTEDGPENEREKEPELSLEDGSLLDGLEITANLDTIGEKSLPLEPGTLEDHRQAETVAVKAAEAALRRIASGAKMKGMVRMGSSNALQSLCLDVSGVTKQRMFDAASLHEPEEMTIHRIPSRSGNIGSMVKVASFGKLGNVHKVGSLSDLHHAGAPGASDLHTEGSAGTRVDDAPLTAGGYESFNWADMSLLIISNSAHQEE